MRGAALAGGASALAVATAAEAAELAAVGVTGGPVGDAASGAGPPDGQPELITLGALTDPSRRRPRRGSAVSVWREGFRELVAARARALGRPARVHVKHDSGMGRLGTFDGEEWWSSPRHRRRSRPRAGRGRTHFATADEPDDDEGYFFEQLDRFEPVAAAVRAEFPTVTVHAATAPRSSASARSHFDMARAGSPSTGSTRSRTTPRPRPGARPLLALPRRRGEALPGRAERRLRPPLKAPEDTWVGVVPLGYGDGCAGRSPTTATSSSPAAASRWSARSRWTT